MLWLRKAFKARRCDVYISRFEGSGFIEKRIFISACVVFVEVSRIMAAPGDGSSVQAKKMMRAKSVVIDFMALVPLSCPPTSAFFKPFVEDYCQYESNNSGYDNVSHVNNNVSSRRSLPIYYEFINDPSRAPRQKYFKKSSSFRTVIKKCDKLVILEEKIDKSHATKLVDGKDDYKVNGVISQSDECAEDSNQFDSSNVDILRHPRLKSLGSVTNVPLNVNLSTLQCAEIRNDPLLTDGTSVDFSSSPSTKNPSILLLNFEDMHYIDISGMGCIERMVDKGELSHVVKPLMSELEDLRLIDLESIEENVILYNEPPMSPNSQVVDTLRAIADQVQNEFEHELNEAVGKLVSLEKSKKLTFEVLREVTMELTKDTAPGWYRVVLPLLLSQTAAIALLLLGYRSVVGKLVDYTTRFICDDMNSLLEPNGGWDGIRSNAFRGMSTFTEESRQNSGTSE